MDAPRNGDAPPRPVPDPGSAGSPARALPSGFDAIALIAEARGARPVALFLDYDGTLTPIVETPELAVLNPAMRDVLRTLSGVVPVGIVSGRDLADLVERVAVPGLVYAGSHGFEVQDAGGRRHVHAEAEEYLDDLDAASAALTERLVSIPGARVERKRFATAVHTRQVADHRKQEVRAAVEALSREYGRLRLTGGKEVSELRPAAPWDKGRVVESLAREWAGNHVLAVYVGDDLTDEDAFRALRGRGIGVIVRARDATGSTPDAPTAAEYGLEGVSEVQRWLSALCARLTGDA